MDCDMKLLLHLIDDCLADLGTAGLVDGRSARDKLLDIRIMVGSCISEPEVIGAE